MWKTPVESHPHPVDFVDKSPCIVLYMMYKNSLYQLFELITLFIVLIRYFCPHFRPFKPAPLTHCVENSRRMWIGIEDFHTDPVSKKAPFLGQNVLFHTIHGTTTTTATLIKTTTTLYLLSANPTMCRLSDFLQKKNELYAVLPLRRIKNSKKNKKPFRYNHGRVLLFSQMRSTASAL